MKIEPAGCIPRRDNKYLCDAFASYTAINQLNKCAGMNVPDKMIPNFVKTLQTSQKAAANILDRVVQDTAINLTNSKLHAAEEQRVRWTTYQNLDLWFDSWERFLLDYGFGEYQN
jgi:hypothetical protein